MKKAVQEFMRSKNNLMSYFQCKDDYFVKPLLSSSWRIKSEDGIYFVSYWNDNEDKKDAVVVKKEGKPLIYKTKDYTMVIGIDCIKLGFVFKNLNEL